MARNNLKQNRGRRNKSNDKPKKMVKNNEGRTKKRYTKTQSNPSSSTIDDDDTFQLGTSVEVTSNDVTGSHVRWYVGTIIPAEKGKTKETTEKNVAYYTIKLETEKGKTVILDNVPPEFVRPLPPRDDNDDVEFEVKDVVDAFYDYGWHVGTVMHVVDNKKKYAVEIKYLNGKVLEFEISKMRVHRDWVDSCWKFHHEKPPKDKEELDKSSTHTPRVSDAPHSESNSEMTDFVDSSSAPTASFTTPSKRPSTNETCESGDVNGQHNGKKGRQYKRKKCVSIGSKENKDALPAQEEAKEETIRAETCESLDDGNNQQNGQKRSQPVVQYKRKKRVSKGSSLPFKKVSPLWAIYESNDYYKKSSQKPHFSPLKADPPERVERMALAKMFRFTEVVKRLKIFKSSDPADIILEDLKIVDDLQSHGFNVSDIKAHLTQLEDWKVKIGQFEEEREKIRKDIEKHEIEKPVIESEIKELKEKLDESERAKKKEESEIKTLKTDLYFVTHEICEQVLACNKLDEIEAVKDLSQTPHFSPLKEFEEDLATFYNNIFKDLVGREFKSSDHMDILVHALEDVVELERHGFHVSAIKAHLNDLQKCKAKMSVLQEREEKIKKDLDKHRMEMLVVDGEVEKFQMKVYESERAKKKKDTEFTKLQSHWNLVSHQILKLEMDIDKLVASPL